MVKPGVVMETGNQQAASAESEKLLSVGSRQVGTSTQSHPESCHEAAAVWDPALGWWLCLQIGRCLVEEWGPGLLTELEEDIGKAS